MPIDESASTRTRFCLHGMEVKTGGGFAVVVGGNQFALSAVQSGISIRISKGNIPNVWATLASAFRVRECNTWIGSDDRFESIRWRLWRFAKSGCCAAGLVRKEGGLINRAAVSEGSVGLRR